MKPYMLNPIRDTRKALYGSLPFVATCGMQNREQDVRRVLSSVSLKSMQDLASMTDITEKLEDIDVDEIIVTFPLIMAVFVAVVSQFLVGYNTAVMNAPASVVFPDHSSLVWSVAVASFAVGGPFGAIFGGYSANRLGRR